MEDKTKLKIIVAEVVKKTTAKGKVLSKGKGRLLANGQMVEPQCEVGDIIVYNPHLLQEIDHEGGKLYLINAQNIYGRLN